jgi:hypothetical protein
MSTTFARTRTVFFLLLAALVWLPNVHALYALSSGERSQVATALASRRVARLTGDGTAEVAQMRGVNPEWDFMTRTYAVLGLTSRALATTTSPAERTSLLRAVDAIVDATLAAANAEGDAHFLLAYARARPFRDPDGRSIFVDGELLFMIAARDLVEPRPSVAAEAAARAERVTRAIERSPARCAESYPDECWAFCNTTALAGLAMLDATTRADHGAPIRAWIDSAKTTLVEPKTGLIGSRFTWDGAMLEGPEGSSIWMIAHNLLFLDPAFARDQYARARAELRGELFGFGWAREWPRTVRGQPDVDSGPIVPWLEASAGSSGLALLGASAFGDEVFLRELLASVELSAFPDHEHGRFRAGNDVGDAVMLAALESGPLFTRVEQLREHARLAPSAQPKRAPALSLSDARVAR